jgi:hypothetical protein
MNVAMEGAFSRIIEPSLQTAVKIREISQWIKRQRSKPRGTQAISACIRIDRFK